jgi:hypothetical protein
MDERLEQRLVRIEDKYDGLMQTLSAHVAYETARDENIATQLSSQSVVLDGILTEMQTNNALLNKGKGIVAATVMIIAALAFIVGNFGNLISEILKR